MAAYVVSGNFDLARLYDLFEFRPEEDIESTTVGGLLRNGWATCRWQARS